MKFNIGNRVKLNKELNNYYKTGAAHSFYNPEGIYIVLDNNHPTYKEAFLKVNVREHGWWIGVEHFTPAGIPEEDPVEMLYSI